MGTLRFFKALSLFALAVFISCSGNNGDDDSYEPPPGEQVRLSIEIIPAGSGVVSPNSGTFLKGEEVTLRPRANNGYFFSHWTGDVSSEFFNETIKMDSDKSVKAVFRKSKNTFLNPNE